MEVWFLESQNKGTWSRHNMYERSCKYMWLNWSPQRNMVCLIQESSRSLLVHFNTTELSSRREVVHPLVHPSTSKCCAYMIAKVSMGHTLSIRRSLGRKSEAVHWGSPVLLHWCQDYMKLYQQQWMERDRSIQGELKRCTKGFPIHAETKILDNLEFYILI